MQADYPASIGSGVRELVCVTRKSVIMLEKSVFSAIGHWVLYDLPFLTRR